MGLSTFPFGYLGLRAGEQERFASLRKKLIMKFRGITARRKVAGAVVGSLLGGVVVGSLLGGVAAATIAAPSAAAAPQGCSVGEVADTVSATWNSARQYLSDHPGANQVFNAALNQPRPQAESDVRSYFTANPGEYYDLKGILAPIGDKQRQCNVTVLPPQLASAYDTFMAG
jgi:hemophore-related protein